ncbi:hypothetical protein SDD30_08590 [Moorella naiadis]|uniref:hypothetical protein n=1 Tax=Moorella naiadis (nom. illeg.) TaxID=3093670 RepID=UPI003D9CB178
MPPAGSAGRQGKQSVWRWGGLPDIDGRIRGRRGIFFLGSGDYHYVAYLLLQHITRPFTLVLFDNHADLLPAPASDLLACGSWVNRALELPNLKKALIIGARPDSFTVTGVAPDLLGKVVYLPWGSSSDPHNEGILRESVVCLPLQRHKKTLGPRPGQQKWQLVWQPRIDIHAAGRHQRGSLLAY